MQNTRDGQVAGKTPGRMELNRHEFFELARSRVSYSYILRQAATDQVMVTSVLSMVISFKMFSLSTGVAPFGNLS